MLLSDARLLAVFAGTFVVAYVVWKFIRVSRKRETRRPPTLWSLPLLGSILFLPDFRIWPSEFLKMSTKIGNVFAFYMGSQYVSHIMLMLTSYMIKKGTMLCTRLRVHSQIKYAMYTASRVPKRLYFVYTHG